MISQDLAMVERFVRQDGGGWLLMDSRELTDTVTLDSVGISIPMGELYRGVVFEERKSDESASEPG